MKEFEQWNGFEGRLWKEEVNVLRLYPEQLHTV